MEKTHGVDVSWLHHSKDPHAVKEAALAASKEHDQAKAAAAAAAADEPATMPAQPGLNGHGSNGASDAKQNGDAPNVAHLHFMKAHLPTKQNEEAIGSPPATPPPTSKESKQRPSETKRRGSWISNISSKFSSSGNQSTPMSSPAPATVSTPEVKEATTIAGATAAVTPPKDAKKEQSTTTAAAASPKSSGFLQSALRRLSSSSGGGGAKVQGNGGICPRKVMNVDPYRDRCQIGDLTPIKLRRVSFCVDVEIAPPVQYDEEEEEPPTPSAMIPGRRPSLVQLEKAVAARKEREKNVKIKDKEKAEGEALKHPDAVAETKDVVGNVEATETKVAPPSDSGTAAATEQVNGDSANGECKKKKKRTEAEKAERRERKRQAALSNGTIPMELTLHHHSSSEDLSTPGTPVLKSQDRPTTDPLRIYRRCCQLRETPVLKRVADQLSAPNAVDVDAGGIVASIDLTGFKIPLSDTMTLGDWLAIVPVRKIMLEDCDLTDEAVRVILSGLLAAKTPEQSRFNRRLSKGARESEGKVERLGVIEKVSLKDNPRVSREGWRHIACFINMSRSLKAIDISGIRMPPLDENASKPHHHHHKHQPDSKQSFNVAEVFEKSLAERVAKDKLEELVMAKCSLDTAMVESVIRGVTACGVRRLGLAYNNIYGQGWEAVRNFILAGRCDGLDLGGNDLSEYMEQLVSVLESPDQPLFALSVADCNLTPQSLKMLLPVLTKLKNFRFIDLSHNHQLFASQPNAIPILRKYLPQMHSLRRMHLNDVAMESEHCIALAEVLPEIPNLAHIGIMDNAPLTALASAVNDEAMQEEACAYYASIMAAVRVSRTIVSLDIEMPSAESTELVKALGKQILAYALRNLERDPAAEALGGLDGRNDSLVEVPDILLHLVGHVDGFPENHDNDAPAPSEDYIVSGTGVVKALGVCLGNRATDRRGSQAVLRDKGTRSSSGPSSQRASGTTTPLQVATEAEVDQRKAKEMSKNLLESARKIRMRLQPALRKEAGGDDEMTYRRLTFLDSTLARMIERFEEEYPECRPLTAADVTSNPSVETSTTFSNPFSPTETLEASNSALLGDDDDGDDLAATSQKRLSRSNSDASLAARVQATEEGTMHRFGQQIRRSLLAPAHFDYHHRTTADDEEAHLALLRQKLETLSGTELKEKVATKGIDAVVRELGFNAAELKRLEKEDPAGWRRLIEAHGNALENIDPGEPPDREPPKVPT